MAASGYTPISLYYSTTASTVPLAANLVAGEIALNTLDEKLYFKNSAGTVKLLASNSSSSATVSSVAMSVPSFLSVSGSPITTSGTLAVTLSGTALPVANGGTGQTSYTDGQLLIGNTTGNTLAKATLTAGSGIAITNGSGTISIAATGGTGTVTSVAQSFTGGIISVGGSPITTSGTLALTVAGTSGGIPYFSSGTAWATSAALAANAIVLGGGAGAAPATTATGTGVVTALGVNTGTAGAFVVNGGALGTPSSGTATNLTGLPLSTGVTGTLALGNGGTGQTTASAAFNALSPITLTGDLIIGNGTNSATRLGIGTNGYILSSNGTTASWTAPAGGGASISNDTATSTNVYPLFAAATSGTPTTIYTGNAKYLYKPSTGELTSSAMISSNGITVNANTIAADYTIAATNNGLSAGPVSVNTGITVTVSTGSVWSIV